MAKANGDRSGVVRVVGVLTIIFGVIYIVAGGVTWGLVTSNLRAEQITVSDDAPHFGGGLVDTPWEAWAQATAIEHHALTASGGKTYAELPQDDPTRTTVMNASFLRASLYTSVVAFGVALLVVGTGIVLLLLGWALHRTGSIFRSGNGVVTAGPADAAPVAAAPVAAAPVAASTTAPAAATAAGAGATAAERADAAAERAEGAAQRAETTAEAAAQRAQGAVAGAGERAESVAAGATQQAEGAAQRAEGAASAAGERAQEAASAAGERASGTVSGADGAADRATGAHAAPPDPVVDPEGERPAT
jgi:hypothetical protein